MATPNDVLRVAAGEIGYYAPNDPQPGSKYGRWMAQKTGESWLAGPSKSVWWCMIFVSWVFDKAGASFGSLPSYNTDTTVARVRAGKGGKLIDIKSAQPGDIVIFDWDKRTAATNHVGIVEKNCGSYIQTIEGNTSGSDWGSQSAGNGVHRRTRNWSVVAYIIRPPYSGQTSNATISNPATSNKKTYADCTWLQRIVGANPDNIWGPDTEKRINAVRMAAKYFGRKFPYGVAYTQRVVGTTADGSWGKNSIAAHDRVVKKIQAGFGIKQDCLYGPDTNKHVLALKAKSHHTV